MGEFDYINKVYGLEIKRGTRVVVNHRPGKIVSARPSHYINIHFDGEKKPLGPFHPLSGITYKK